MVTRICTLLKRIFPVLILAIFHSASLANDTEIIYYGPNDSPSNKEKALKKIEIREMSENRVWVHTYLKQQNDWNEVKKEMIRVRTPLHHSIRYYEGKLLQYKAKRIFEKNDDGSFRFKEVSGGRTSMEGGAIRRIPLILDGMVIKYYDNGKKKSESFYEANQLVWNRNWLKNGDKYIDSIFYSVDKWPVYLNGELEMKTLLNNRIVSSSHYSRDLSGTVLLGFVIMEDGQLEGVRVQNEPVMEIAEVAAEAFESLPGKWSPAVLDNRKVRCFMTYPINFIQQGDLQLQEVEIIGNMMFYNYR